MVILTRHCQMRDLRDRGTVCRGSDRRCQGMVVWCRLAEVEVIDL